MFRFIVFLDVITLAIRFHDLQDLKHCFLP